MKKLISSADIRQAKSNQQTYILAPANECIITPEARDLAEAEGVEIRDAAPPQAPAEYKPATDPKATIQQAVESHLGEVDANTSEQIKTLIAKALADFNFAAPDSPRQINDDGILLVRGNAVTLGEFDGAPGKQIGLTDVVGVEDGSNMGVGYMGWENAFFPWTLCYDEVNVVLEGELHVKTAAGTTIANPGDVIFIPKGSSVEFGTPTRVRYVYITYPADWA
ncbi:ethanolamine utilization acetate kinase EutQ [Ferrimonas aestuarii]|uniref:Ethanolamine utilization acetate kinase EutQ n=1 Tax=Ferrimonas aestuarii TaxID=2569539 RepID=A0A4U1BQ90_9GAMM|nr:ethanolamine utilization acetate kinase EutQ [Ferrimonas aestuarii]TKB56576.1 ethanolamine utilization acetate kinase EutQ [Ferrimonas aestuarii]